MKKISIILVLAAVPLFTLPFAPPSYGAEPAPVTNPSDITGGDFPPEHYVVLPVPRGELAAAKHNPLLHRDFLDEQGNKLGTVEKLILDTKTGKIVYAVVSLEDGRLVPLPWSDLKATPKQHAVVLSASKARLDTALGETAKEIKSLMRPGMLTSHHTIKGELVKIDGGDYVLNNDAGQRVRLHIENGTKIHGDPKAGDKIEATVNDFDTAISIRAHNSSLR
jgi:sporulation protein YlmC with PRC-barrel domain